MRGRRHFILTVLLCCAAPTVLAQESDNCPASDNRGLLAKFRPAPPCDSETDQGSVLYQRLDAETNFKFVEKESGRPDPVVEILEREPVPTTHVTLNAALLDPDPMIAPDGQAQLQLRDVLLHTIRTSPEIEIAFWQLEDARYAVKAAGAARLPQVEANAATGYEESRLENPPDATTLTRTEAGVRVSQQLFDFGRTGETIKRSKAIRQSRTLLYRDAVEETLLTAIIAYLDLLGADQLRANANDNVKAHERIVDLVDKSFRGGNVSEAELKRAQTRLDRARTTALDQEERYERAVNEFQRITGMAPAAVDEPQLDLSAASSLTRESIDAFLSDHNLMQATFRDIASLQHQINVAKRAYLPSVSLQVVGAYKDNVLGNEQLTTDGRAMLSVSWSMFDGGASLAKAGQIAARRNETEARLRQLRNELRQDAYNVITVLETAREKRAIFEEQVATSERVSDLYAKQFQAGRRTLLDLLDAQDDLYTARADDIATRYEMLGASFTALRFQNILTETLADQLNLAAAVGETSEF